MRAQLDVLFSKLYFLLIAFLFLATLAKVASFYLNAIDRELFVRECENIARLIDAVYFSPFNLSIRYPLPYEGEIEVKGGVLKMRSDGIGEIERKLVANLSVETVHFKGSITIEKRGNSLFLK